MNLYLEVLVSLVVPLLGASAWPAVKKMEERFGFELDGASRWAMAGALSLAWIQVGAEAMLALGILHAPILALWIGSGVLASFVFGRRPVAARPSLPPGPTVLTAIVMLGYLAIASVPAWQPDDMTYHLALGRQFAQAHRYVMPDDNIFASFPLGWQSLQAALHTFGSAPDFYPPFAGRLLTAWISLWTALSVVGLARSLGVEARTAAWCAPVFLLVPTVLEYGASAYVESWLVLLTTLGLALVLRGSRSPSIPVAIPAVLAGLALQVKYPAVAFFTFVFLVLLLDALRRGPSEERPRLVRAVIFGVTAGLVGAPFYLRNWVMRGNPVFPTGFGFFGGEGWDEWRAWAYSTINGNYGMGRDPEDWLLLPVRMFTTRELEIGFEGALGPVLGVGALLGIVRTLRERDRGFLLLVVFLSAWTAFWALTTQQLRFYLPAVPTVVVLGAVAVEKAPTTARPWIVPLGVALHLAWSWPSLSLIFLRQHTDKWIAGQASREQILSVMLPESFPLMAEVERLVPPDGKIWLVWMRAYTYYFPLRDYRLDCVFESWRFDELIDQAATLEDIPRQLRGAGFTHLLVNDRFMITLKGKEMYPGRTEKIVSRYTQLETRGLLVPKYRWRTVVLYEVRAPDEN